MSTEIGKNIMAKRKELGITQEELARRMGYKSKSTINKIELGINDIPQSKIIKFAEVLNTTPMYLLGLQQTQKKNDIMADIVVKMRMNDEYLSICEMLYNLEDDKLAELKQFLTVFVK